MIVSHQAFEKSYNDYFLFTIRLLRKVTGRSLDQCEEFAQAAWVRGWEYRSQLRDNHKIHLWVATIAINIFRNWERKRFREQSLVEDQAVSSTVLIDIEQKQDAETLLQLCPLKFRSALIAHFLDGESYVELGSMQTICALRPKPGEVFAGERAIKARAYRGLTEIRSQIAI